jgi:hypothetical protein
MVTKSKNIKRQKADLLGMPVGTAERKLRKAIIHELSAQLGKNLCRFCNSPISEPDDLAITHVKDWEDDPDQYWALTNIAFSHVSCAAEHGGQRQREKRKMSRIEVKVLDENNKTLPGTRHKGQLYVGGEKDSRYTIKVKNKTGKRLLLVTTVDGRNVQDGEIGDVDGPGFVLDPYASWTYKGWRTSDDEVAAFQLGKKDDSYSSQLGSAEHVGVIGVAVFEEFEPDPIIKTVKETIYVPLPYPSDPWPKVKPWPGTTGPSWTITNTSNSSGGTFGSSGPISVNTNEILSSSNISVDVDSVSITSASALDLGAQELGTGWGETITSSVKEASFMRASEDPAEVHTIRYDSMDALVSAGILRPKRVKEDRQPFPNSPKANKGYCKPPKKVLRR